MGEEEASPKHEGLWLAAGSLGLPFSVTSPSFWAPVIGLVEDSFSMDPWRGMAGSDGSGTNASDGEPQMKLCWLAAHLLLCGLFPNRPRTGTGPDWYWSVACGVGTPGLVH